jgi:anti-sigma B factor antagonist
MNLTVDSAPTLTCIAVEGELDTATAPDLESAIQACLADGTMTLLLDLATTDYVSSMGLRVFLSTLKSLKATGGRLVLAGLNEEVQEIIDLAGFAPLFEICGTADQARVLLAG